MKFQESKAVKVELKSVLALKVHFENRSSLYINLVTFSI